jgi:NAD(P)-dependent dehydrogenase (short-subunit alcohol dehydrogenase family)
MILTDKVCLVTGGTRGIGAAAAISFAKAGADVAITGRRLDDEAKQTKAAIEKLGRKCLLIGSDVSKPDEPAKSVERTVAELGGIDLLVHSAGGPVNGGLLELTPEAWLGAFDVHIHPIFHLCRAAIPHMRKKREGVVILVSSTAGIRGIKTNVAYQTVKGAIPQLTRALAYEFAPDNIRVNCVAPGVVRTAFHATMTEATRQFNLEHRIPLKREGKPEQVATVILELATNDYITGETVVVDGGLTMRIA